jgi:dUTP pyrophosphatase
LLKVQKLDPRATVPTCQHPGEDLAFDVYALEDATLSPGIPAKVRTGIAACFEPDDGSADAYGLLVRDRSSLASKGIITAAGVIDAGYRGEILIVMHNVAASGGHHIHAGDKVAQMIPIPVRTSAAVEVLERLPEARRGAKGFGSSGR